MTTQFNFAFFEILTNNSDDLLDGWQATATSEEQIEAFLQSARMGWMPGVVKMAALVKPSVIDQGVSFAMAGHHFDVLKSLIPLSTPRHLAGDAISYAVDHHSLQAIQLLLPVLPQMSKDVMLARAAGQGSMDVVGVLRPECGVIAIRSALEQAAKEGCINIVQALAPHCNFKHAYNRALILAAQGGWLDTVDFLLPGCHQDAINQAFNMAAGAGYIEVVEQLLPHCDPANNDSTALRYAAENGFVECVQLLIPLSNPLCCESWALRKAAENGRVECVKLLLPVSDPKANSSDALYEALANGHMECAEVLGLVSDLQSVREQFEHNDDNMYMDDHDYSYDVVTDFLEDMMVRQQKKLLETHIEKRRSGMDVEPERAQRKI